MHGYFASYLCAALLVTCSCRTGRAYASTGNQDFKVTYESYLWSITSHYDIERSDGSHWRASRNNLTSVLGFKYYLYDADGQSLGTLASAWKDPIALRVGTANLELRDAVGDRRGRLRGKFWNDQFLQLDIYDGHNIIVGVVQCSILNWTTCEVKSDPRAPKSVATMQHTSWNVWDIVVHRDGLINQELLEIVPLYLHDYLRAAVYYRAVAYSAYVPLLP